MRMLNGEQIGLKPTVDSAITERLVDAPVDRCESLQRVGSGDQRSLILTQNY